MGRDMKNKIKSIFKILVVTAGCLMFASFSPSLDGRAVVVDDGVFPQGLFAKTVGYLPGDIISVTNIAGDLTIDLLVIGALDPSEGVAIMLSPEAAQAMGIEKGSNNIVKITKRSGQDERVYGNAVISKSTAAIDDWDDGKFDSIADEENTDAFEEPEELEESEETEENTDAEETEETLTEEPEENLEESAEDFEEPEEELEEESEDFEEEEDFEETEPEEALVEEELEEDFDSEEPEEEALEEPEPQETEEEFAEEDLGEEYSEETPDALEEEPEEESLEAEELDELPEETVEEELEEAEEENPEADETAEEADDIPAEESFDEEAYDAEKLAELPAEEEKEEAVEEDVPAEELFIEDELEALPDENESDVNSEAETFAEETEESEETESEEEYEAIVLVPADSNPPEAEVDEVEDVVSGDELEAIEDIVPVEENEENAPITLTPVSEPAEKTEKEVTSYDKYIVPSLKNLESGKYYIQIAVYAADENILEIINKYGNNYPVTIVPMAGGASKQILIGPVTMDEYKVVLERFKSYGFKDAFLRKVR